MFEEFFVDKHLNTERIRAVVAQIAGLIPTTVAVVEDAWLFDDAERYTIVCEVISVRGDFAQRIGIYLRDTALTVPPPHTFVAQFCAACACSALLPDDSVNPYTWLLMQPSGTIQPVSLDANQFDNDVYVVRRDSDEHSIM